jgi:hypothetical protein
MVNGMLRTFEESMMIYVINNNNSTALDFVDFLCINYIIFTLW